MHYIVCIISILFNIKYCIFDEHTIEIIVIIKNNYDKDNNNTYAYDR